MMEKEIKPCPFCGGEGRVERISMRRGNKDLVYVRCIECHAEAHKFCEGAVEREDDAIKAWNRRV